MKTALEDFRLETRQWLEENCPASMRTPVKDSGDFFWGGRNATFQHEDQKIWFERMLEKKWIVPYWDTKYGGGGLSDAENNILTQEMTRLGCRKPIFSFGISMLGPALHKFATEEQKMRFLPEITAGKTWWCQGYSEPNAGSDLAGLQTKAEDMGDHYLINGSKVWTSYADKSDWIFCLVRTDFDAPKHNGISFILFDMTTTGVTTKPIQLISGASPFCETFFDDVSVPRENLVGPLNDGWTIAKRLLQHERTMISGMGMGGSSKKGANSIPEQAKRYAGESENKIANAALRDRILRHQMNGQAFAVTLKRSAEEAKLSTGPSATSSMFKYYGTEQNKNRYEVMLDLMGTNNKSLI